MMTAMRGRWLIWGGAAVAVAALAGLGWYVARAGLAEADQLASVLGLVVAVAGLGISVSGLLAARRDGQGSGGSRRSRSEVEQDVDASGQAEMVQAGRDVNENPPVQPGVADHGTGPNTEETGAAAGAGESGDTGDADARGVGVVRQRATAVQDGRVYQAGRDFTEGGAARSAPDADADDAGGGPGEVRQEAKVSGSGRIYQAGRDINKR